MLRVEYVCCSPRVRKLFEEVLPLVLPETLDCIIYVTTDDRAALRLVEMIREELKRAGYEIELAKSIEKNIAYAKSVHGGITVTWDAKPRYAVIYLHKSAGRNTIAHELGHVYIKYVLNARLHVKYTVTIKPDEFDLPVELYHFIRDADERERCRQEWENLEKDASSLLENIAVDTWLSNTLYDKYFIDDLYRDAHSTRVFTKTFVSLSMRRSFRTVTEIYKFSYYLCYYLFYRARRRICGVLAGRLRDELAEKTVSTLRTRWPLVDDVYRFCLALADLLRDEVSSWRRIVKMERTDVYVRHDGDSITLSIYIRFSSEYLSS